MATENIPPMRNIRHLRPQKEWKEIIAIYLYLAGMGAGSFVIGTLISWFVKWIPRSSQPSISSAYP